MRETDIPGSGDTEKYSFTKLFNTWNPKKQICWETKKNFNWKCKRKVQFQWEFNFTKKLDIVTTEKNRMRVPAVMVKFMNVWEKEAPDVPGTAKINQRNWIGG